MALFPSLISSPLVSAVFIVFDVCSDRRALDKDLNHVPRAKIREQLLDVGFDDERQAETVGGLSGGWKMKLELARAMLYNADLLLLDEPTNHVSFPAVFVLSSI